MSQLEGSSVTAGITTVANDVSVYLSSRFTVESVEKVREKLNKINASEQNVWYESTGYKFMNNAEINSFSIYINNVFYGKLM